MSSVTCTAETGRAREGRLAWIGREECLLDCWFLLDPALVSTEEDQFLPKLGCPKRFVEFNHRQRSSEPDTQDVDQRFDLCRVGELSAMNDFTSMAVRPPQYSEHFLLGDRSVFDEMGTTQRKSKAQLATVLGRSGVPEEKRLGRYNQVDQLIVKRVSVKGGRETSDCRGR